MATKKIQCGCKHEFQDKKYGKGVRIANTTAKKPTPGTVIVRCSVCASLQTVGD